jgi:hypothetical protein
VPLDQNALELQYTRAYDAARAVYHAGRGASPNLARVTTDGNFEPMRARLLSGGRAFILDDHDGGINEVVMKQDGTMREKHSKRPLFMLKDGSLQLPAGSCGPEFDAAMRKAFNC